MKFFFCLTVRFIQPYCHGRGDGSEPEWPPSPLRVFQALIAAAAARWNERMQLEYAAPSLRWLERQPHPMVIAVTGAVSDVKYRLYVPDNIADKVAKSWSGGREGSIADYRTEKDVRPTHLRGSNEDENAVHYLYPLPEDRTEFERHRGTLQAAANSITHLGWGVDMAVGDVKVVTQEEADRLPGERWQPVPVGGTPLRVPMDGTLADLAIKHDRFLSRLSNDGFNPVPPLSAFRVVDYRRATDPIHRPFVAFRLWHPEEDRMAHFSATRAVSFAGMIRHATAEAARRSDWDEADVVQYILGHRDDPDDTLPRFAYVPLPTIEPPPRNVAGAIRRVLIAEPVDSPGKHVAWLKQFMPGQVITDDEGMEVAVLERIENDGVVQRYVKSAITWTTVTPVALPGSDEGKANKTDKLLEKMFRHAGYSIDAVAELDFHRVPFLRGAEDAKRYRPMEPHYLANCTMYHMRIRWKHPMAGPLVLGSGRFCGLGVFAAIND